MGQTFTFRWVDVLLLMPVISLVVTSMIPLLIKVMTGNKEQNSFATLCYGLVGVIAAGGWLVMMSGQQRVAFEGALVFDGLSLVAGLVIIGITAFALVYAKENLATNNNQFSEFVFLMMNSAAGMLLVSWSNDLIFFFVGLEMMSLCLYILIAMSSEERLSKEAAFKYFLLGSFASAILLYGVAFIFGSAGTTNLPVMADQAGQLITSNRFFLVGLVFLILGLCFKVSIFPLHAWTPDVYQGSPTPITAFMATGAKLAVFVLFLRLLSSDALLADQTMRQKGSISFIDVLQWLAVLTIVVGNIAAVMQSNLKRMLAYSSVAHSGYILIGVIVAALGGTDMLGQASVMFYLFAYTLMTVGAFGVLSIFEKDEDSSLRVEDLRGLASRRPWLSLCFTLFLLSMAGIPPAIGFFSKLFIFSAALKVGLVWLTVWGVIGSLISVYYYLRPIVYMYMVEDDGAEVVHERDLSIGLVSIVAVLILGLGIFSSPIYKTIFMALSRVLPTGN